MSILCIFFCCSAFGVRYCGRGPKSGDRDDAEIDGQNGLLRCLQYNSIARVIEFPPRGLSNFARSQRAQLSYLRVSTAKRQRQAGREPIPDQQSTPDFDKIWINWERP
jgi:hypothetical protein